MSLTKPLPIVLRMDDVGASSKRYEVYSDFEWRKAGFHVSGNWLFLKFLPGLRKWGPYRELRVRDWEEILNCLELSDAKLTVGITACWAEDEDHIIPFPKKFPGQASKIREGLNRGLLEIANHGLTHVLLANNAFKPRWFSGNRKYHREFLDEIPIDIQESNINRAQDILQSYFQTEVVTLIPPGNAFSEKTVQAAAKHGIKYISCNAEMGKQFGIVVLGNQMTVPFHDRELVLQGIDWLKRLVDKYQRFLFVKELGEQRVDLIGEIVA